MTETTLTDVAFTSGGTTCRGRHQPARSAALAGAAGAPCVVMAHGLGGTADSGLEPFAEALAEAGLHVLVFDYRGFGRSDGEPRQVVSPGAQQDDFRAALAAAARLDGVDPTRLVLWGVSLAGGHVLEVAAGRDDVAAVVAVVPLVDGRAAALQASREHRPAELATATVRGIAARARGAIRGSTDLVPLVGPPGSGAVLSLAGYDEAYRSVAGPTWRNEVDAAVATRLGSFRPARRAGDLSVPVLVQVCDLDRSAAPQAAAKAAFRARAEVRHYRGDHFDLFPGRPWHDLAVEHQVHFLARHLAPRPGQRS